MKLFRYLTFFLSFLIISGHDIVPHIHEDDHDPIDHSATLPISSADNSANLQNLFSHFQHSANEGHFVYLTTIKKQINFQKKSFASTIFFTSADNPLALYANYKKQRFKDYVKSPPNYILSSSSLRGPPTC